MSPTPARAKAAAVKPYELIGRPPVTSHRDSVTSGVTGSVAGVTLAVTGSTTVEVTGYPTSDGRVTIVMSPFRTLVGVLGDDSLLAYDDPKQLFDKRDEIWECIAALTKSWTTRELLDAMLAVDIWCGQIQTHPQVKDDPQVRHMGTLKSYEHSTAGTVQVVGPAVRFSETLADI